MSFFRNALNIGKSIVEVAKGAVDVFSAVSGGADGGGSTTSAGGQGFDTSPFFSDPQGADAAFKFADARSKDKTAKARTVKQKREESGEEEKKPGDDSIALSNAWNRLFEDSTRRKRDSA